MRDVSFPTAATGFALDSSGGLFRTTDGGATWRALDTGSTAVARAVLATSATNVLVVGPRGVRRSTDGGDTFNAVRGINLSRLSGVDRAGSALVAWGDQDLWRSTRPGPDVDRAPQARQADEAAQRQEGQPAPLVAADFISANVGYVATGDYPQGGLYRTANGGKTLGAPGGDRHRHELRRRPLVLERQEGATSWSAPASGNAALRSDLISTTDGGARGRRSSSSPDAHRRRAASRPAPTGRTTCSAAMSNLLCDDDRRHRRERRRRSPSPTKQRRFTKRPAAASPSPARSRPRRPSDAVTVSYLPPGTRIAWQHQTVKADASGKFTTSWRAAQGHEHVRRPVAGRLPELRAAAPRR